MRPHLLSSCSTLGSVFPCLISHCHCCQAGTNSLPERGQHTQPADAPLINSPSLLLTENFLEPKKLPIPLTFNIVPWGDWPEVTLAGISLEHTIFIKTCCIQRGGSPSRVRLEMTTERATSRTPSPRLTPALASPRDFLSDQAWSLAKGCHGKFQLHAGRHSTRAPAQDSTPLPLGHLPPLPLLCGAQRPRTPGKQRFLSRKRPGTHTLRALPLARWRGQRKD